MSNIDKLRHWLFLGLILLAGFSFYPSVALPAFDFSSFRIGLYQLMATAFLLICIPLFVKQYIKNKQSKEDRLVITGSILMVLLSLFNLVEAINTRRSLLMVGSFGLLIGLVLVTRWYVASSTANTNLVINLMLKAGIIIGLVSVLQLVIGTFTSTDSALLCSRCGSDVFGFPRISGFSAEALFWANVCLPFFAVAIASYLRKASDLSFWSLVATSIAIALTFSRGAFVALGIGLTVLVIKFRTKKHASLGQIKRSISTVVFSFAIGFCLLIGSASIRYHDTPNIAYNTLRSMVEHLSLGKINLPDPKVEAVEEFESQGYVEASSEDRISAAKTALNIWFRPGNIVTGVGLGNLGPYAVENIDSSLPSNLTVYVFYILFLAEMGILGLALLMTLYFVSIRRLFKQASVESITVATILIMFLAQYWFFGSYINVVYIWLWLGIGLGLGKIEQGSRTWNIGRSN